MLLLGSTPVKRDCPKKCRTLTIDRYPTLYSKDEINEADEKKFHEALREMTSRRPRNDVLLPLLNKTFLIIRQCILHKDLSFTDIIKNYPVLKEPITVYI